MLDYLNRDLYESLGGSKEACLGYEKCSGLVAHDSVFLTESAWREAEQLLKYYDGTLY